ncbi:MAG: CoA pyrophosphatase [Chloroflexi bacterium]|nr:CoA pyrophosphatase [Chloroflexota bacterium]
MSITLAQLRAAVELPEFDAQAAQLAMAPHKPRIRPETGARQAGVLVLVYPELDDRLQLVLTRRTDTLRGHSGQISFPGGRRDPQDESFAATALRETCEELGLCEQDITILGALTPIYIPPSNFEVFPTVGALPLPPVFHPNPAEVAEVLPFPVDNLLDPRYKSTEDWTFQGMAVRIPFYTVGPHKVWGATAIMLSELEHRLRRVVLPTGIPNP